MINLFEGEWVQVVSPTLTKKDKKKSSEVAAAVVSINGTIVYSFYLYPSRN